LVWGVNGAFIMGIFFTMFISWIKFPAKQSASPPGLVPDKIIDVASFQATAGALDFNWGENTGGQGRLGGWESRGERRCLCI
jgi:AGZA family xanthine/uracil permease-like MFS transporter